jgi:CheY-like chemotaxis protein
LLVCEDSIMTDLSKRRVLIVDEILIALFLEEILEELGCVVIGIATGREEGLELIQANLGALDAAMLDINLGDDTTSHDIAAALAAAGVPFIVTTGYDDAPQLVGFEGRPRLEKPYDKDGVALALRLLYRTGNDTDQL